MQDDGILYLLKNGRGYTADKNKLEAALDDLIREEISHFAGKTLPPGWKKLSNFTRPYEILESIELKELSEENAAELVTMAYNDAHAFDLACIIAGKHIEADMVLPNSLKLFTVSVLSREIARPTQVGRPPADDAANKLLQYCLCVIVSKVLGLQLSRNPTSSAFTACDAVAESYQRLGTHVTSEQLQALCHADGYSEIRYYARLLYPRAFSAK